MSSNISQHLLKYNNFPKIYFRQLLNNLINSFHGAVPLHDPKLDPKHSIPQGPKCDDNITAQRNEEGKALLAISPKQTKSIT